MSDKLFKFKILCSLLSGAFYTWKTDVWRRDLDSNWCCSGSQWDECGCGGASVRDIWSHQTMKPPT